MTKRIPFVVLVVLLATLANAQTREAAYAEVGGSGIIPTANYERYFTDTFAAHVGLGIVSVESDIGDEGWAVSVPMVGSWISHPRSNHHLEAGGGALVILGESDSVSAIDDDSFSNFGVTGLLGYRYQKPGRGFLFRATYTPVYSDGEFTNFGGLSFGYAWNR